MHVIEYVHVLFKSYRATVLRSCMIIAQVNKRVALINQNIYALVQTKEQFMYIRTRRLHDIEVTQAYFNWFINLAIIHNENLAQSSNGVCGGGILSTKSREH